MNENTLAKIWDYIIVWAKANGPDILLAIATLIIGWWAINTLVRFLRHRFKKRNLDKALQTFLLGLVKIGLRVILFVVVISMLGVATASLVAVLGAAGLAIGLSLQGSLSNFAGGVIILTFRPFRVGDFIQAQNESGSVREIGIMYTVLYTAQNQKIIIPNGQLANNNIINYSAEDTRRMDLVIGIGYDDDLKKAKDVLMEIMQTDKRFLSEPEQPFVAVTQLNASSVDITIRAWAKSSDYWGALFDTQEKIKLEFDEKGISIPYPQQVVHYNQSPT